MKASYCLVRILNFFERARKYKTKWVEDLPEILEKNTVYIIGGREHPFYAAVTCPRKNCKKTIHLEIAADFKKRWKFQEHGDGTLSLNPSIHIADSPCGCHYWIKKGCVVWCDIPPLFVPEENQTSQSHNRTL